MISPKRPKLTARQERDAYAAATARDDDTCQRCQRYCGPVQRDHRQGRDAYNTVVSNLQCLGMACHQWKTEHPVQAVLDGWAVPRHTTLTPAEWPARRRIRTQFGTVRLGWVLYFDEPELGRWWLEISDMEAQYRMHKGGRA